MRILKDLRWLRATLRFVAAGLLFAAAAKIPHGGLTLQTEAKTSANGVSVDHIVTIGHLLLVLILASVLLVALSFVIPPKRV